MRLLTMRALTMVLLCILLFSDITEARKNQRSWRGKSKFDSKRGKRKKNNNFRSGVPTGGQSIDLGSLFTGPSSNDKESSCGAECKRKDCDNTSIRYGRYCGVGHGCSNDEYEPCDAYDACCQQHDMCVTRTSVMDNQCHTQLQQCLDRAVEVGEKGFGEGDVVDGTCPLPLVVETIKQGMVLSKMFGNLFRGEL